jgi:hypothetical protein
LLSKILRVGNVLVLGLGRGLILLVAFNLLVLLLGLSNVISGQLVL